jgi:protease IV
MQYAPRHRVWPWVLVGLAGFFLFICFIGWFTYHVASAGSDSAGMSAFGGNIGVIDVDGVILTAETTENDLRRFVNDDSIKAIVLHINSPGGGAAASQEIYHEVLRIREKKKKPIVCSVESVGASGAYYIASGCDKIYANDASVVGSIGVIAEWVNYGELMKWAKLKEVTFKAGDLKEAGTPTRDPTPAEAAYLQSLIDNMHTQFIHDVAVGRGMKDSDIQAIASGRVWTGEDALPLHLIDKIGTFQDCLRDTAKSVGISGDPTVVKPPRPRAGLWALITGDTDVSILDPAKTLSHALEQNPNFYYLWK